MSADNKSEKTGRSGPAKRQREATRTAILQSVGRIVSEEGADALTIDEVARAAALSKGGVLHHFPSKEALLLAAIRHDLDLFDEMVAHLEESDPGMPGAYTRAYLRVCVKSFERAHDEGLAFLHQFRSIPSTIELVREYKARWHQRLEEDGLDAEGEVVAEHRFESGNRAPTDGSDEMRSRHYLFPGRVSTSLKNAA